MTRYFPWYWLIISATSGFAALLIYQMTHSDPNNYAAQILGICVFMFVMVENPEWQLRGRFE